MALLGLGMLASAGASVVGGAMQSSAAKGGASAQADAANRSAMLQYRTAQESNQLIQQIYAQNTQRLQPFVSGGQTALGALQDLTGTNPGGNAGNSFLTGRFEPTMARLAQTPGYEFALQQGLLGVQSGSSAIGHGSAVSGAGVGNTTPGAAGIGPSGPLGKALANYSEGLASTTFQQQFGNWLAENMQTYNMLSGMAGIGENAAAQTGNMGTAAGQSGANALMGGAAGYGSYSTAASAATASGMVGSANALSNGLTGVGNSALLYGLVDNANTQAKNNASTPDSLGGRTDIITSH